MDATPEDVQTVLLLGAGESSTKVGSTTAGGSTDLTGTIDVCSSESTYSCCIFIKQQ